MFADNKTSRLYNLNTPQTKVSVGGWQATVGFAQLVKAMALFRDHPYSFAKRLVLINTDKKCAMCSQNVSRWLARHHWLKTCIKDCRSESEIAERILDAYPVKLHECTNAVKAAAIKKAKKTGKKRKFGSVLRNDPIEKDPIDVAHYTSVRQLLLSIGRTAADSTEVANEQIEFENELSAVENRTEMVEEAENIPVVLEEGELMDAEEGELIELNGVLVEAEKVRDLLLNDKVEKENFDSPAIQLLETIEKFHTNRSQDDSQTTFDISRGTYSDLFTVVLRDGMLRGLASKICQNVGTELRRTMLGPKQKRLRRNYRITIIIEKDA